MKFITVRDLRTTPAKIWKELPSEQEIVITNNGHPIALLTPLSDDNLEESLKAVRQARAINAVNKLQSESIKSGRIKITETEINAEIAATRKNRVR